jgi:hypothetical protein
MTVSSAAHNVGTVATAAAARPTRIISPVSVLADTGVPTRKRVACSDNRRMYSLPAQCSALVLPVSDGG